MTDLVRAHGLALVVALVFVTELGVPSFIPNEVPLLLVGAYDVQTAWRLTGAIAMVAAADLLATTGLFLMIRSGGRRLAAQLLRGYAGDQALGRWRRRLGRSRWRDAALVASGRLLPLVRTPFAMTMALLDIGLPRYLLGALPGSLLWASGPLIAGYLLRDDVEDVIDPLQRSLNAFGIGVGALALLLGAAMLARAKCRPPIHPH